MALFGTLGTGCGGDVGRHLAEAGGDSASTIGGTSHTGGTRATGGTTARGGNSATGGATQVGGATSAGGAAQTGGAPASTSSGGTASIAGASSSGGTNATGATRATGGVSATGGTRATAGASNTGGTKATGGTGATGGSNTGGGTSGGTKATGGAGGTATGGTEATGGAATGGTKATGGAATGGAATGGAATGGTVNTGGSDASGGAGTGGASAACPDLSLSCGDTVCQDGCETAQSCPADCGALVFANGDVRRVTTPAWVLGGNIAECGFQPMIGLSVSTASVVALGHAALCGFDDPILFPHTACTAFAFGQSDARYYTATGDWDPNFYKGECAVDGYVAGIGMLPYGIVDALLCCTGPGLTHSNCTTETMYSSDAREPGVTSGDWDPNFYKGECGPGRYMAGVAANQFTLGNHSILCCSP